MPLLKRKLGISKRTKQRRLRKERIKALADQLDAQQILNEYRHCLSFPCHNQPIVEPNLTQVNENEACCEPAEHHEIIETESLGECTAATTTIDDNIDAFEVIHEETEQGQNADDNNPPNENILCASLLTVFFNANLTQEALKIVIEHTQLFTNIKIPKTFNQLMVRINNEKLDYEKVWFCQYCEVKCELSNTKQRICSSCNNK